MKIINWLKNKWPFCRHFVLKEWAIFPCVWCLDKYMKKELWLSVKYVDGKGQTDLLWYNEGNASEFPMFLKLIWRRITRDLKTKMQYEMRYGKTITFIL